MKVQNSSYTKHFLALAILFVLGNGVITAPQKNADRYNFLAFLAACIIAIVAYFLFAVLPLNKVTVAGVWLLAFYCIADAFITFIKFISENLLPQTQPFLIVLPIVLILLYFAFMRVEALFKFSLISAAVTAGVILFFFFATAKDFNFSNIFISRLPDIKGLFGQFVPYFKSIVLPCCLLSVFGRFYNIKKRIGFFGIGLGFLAFGLCVLNSVLLFGIELSGALDYPYSSAGSTVTFGNLFTRMDGFLYFVYLASVTVKCAVGIFIIKKSREMLP